MRVEIPAGAKSFRIMAGIDSNNTTYNAEEEGELREDVESEIKKFGGIMISDSDSRKTDFAISFMHSRSDYYSWKDKAANFLTYDWLTQNKSPEFPLTDDWHHLVYFCRTNRVFSGIVATPAGYKDDFDQTIIRDIIIAGGGQIETALERGKTTHLIIETAEGKKFNAAKKWGLPTVTMAWLYECCIWTLTDSTVVWNQIPTGKFQPQRGFEPECFQAPVQLPQPMTSKNQNRRSLKAEPKSRTPMSRRSSTSGQRGFNVADLLDDCETPECRKKTDMPRTSEIHRGLARAVDETSHENCEKKKRGLFSKSAIKEKKERMNFPKTPKYQVKFVFKYPTFQSNIMLGR